MWLNKCLKSLVSGDSTAVNILKVLKHCLNLHVLSYLFITLRETKLENFSLSDMRNLVDVC